MEQAQLTSFFAYGGYRPIDSDFLLSDSNIPSDPSDSQSCITTLLFSILIAFTVDSLANLVGLRLVTAELVERIAQNLIGCNSPLRFGLLLRNDKA